ncbi:Homeobox-leucine zipper protein ATHB-40 [Sesamum angolense]|uniref:Homeobox-leucine zipper protein n=1 Tax=Sesamum angolense TaxID=2727404 RepID=A0AAE1XF10_9LAMI|nr:Homeobox-leucine zipper protein ATHB-40 [Sesamum angolense]
MMINSEFDDQMVLISGQYYPVGIISQFVQGQGVAAAVEESKPRRRRRKKNGDGDGDGEAVMMRKRKLSEEQANMLEKSFGSEHKLESERKERLAAELGLDPRQVAVWFQNRRARWRSKKLEEEFSKLRSHHDSTLVEKCRLETELVKVKEQLQEAEKEIQRLSERWDHGFSSNSPSSSTNMEQPPLLGFEGLENVFCVPHDNNYGHGFEWDNFYYL